MRLFVSSNSMPLLFQKIVVLVKQQQKGQNERPKAEVFEA